MASPLPMASTGLNNVPAAGEADEYGGQIKAMGLKVHYTFDKEAKINCLARGSHPLQVHTIPVTETTTIGVVDLRACIHTITECSPELANQPCDYTIYAVDYSEPDTPLVGQGLLSWALDSMRPEFGNQHPPKVVTGRVTKNILGVFGGGSRETLEVRLKLSETNKIQRQQSHVAVEPQPSRPMEGALTPTSTAEWTSFIQSNPQIGQPASQSRSYGQTSRVASPALSQGPPPPLLARRDSFGSNYAQPPSNQEVQKPLLAPAPTEYPSAPTPPVSAPSPALAPTQASVPAPSSRPSSRVSNRRRKPPTGRPRGRPRKKPAEGNTSGYEDGTEGEEAPMKEEEPAKKRAKITKIDKSNSNAFAPGSESLRVTASTSSSLRNFRPIGNHSDSVTGSHLQEVPRAPTPVPNGSLRGLPGRGSRIIKLRRSSSSMSQQAASSLPSFNEQKRYPSPCQEDSRSPESAAPTPAFSEDSPPDIGSSPPVQRATPYIRSSPPPSSPVLPPMPPREPSVPTNDMDELFGEEPPTMEEELPLPLPPPIIRNRAAKQSPGVPIQVFQLQDVPGGQDLVQVASYNTPHPSSSTAGPGEGLSLATIKKAFARPQALAKRKRPRASSPPRRLAAPTPPPTTDAVEKAVSPAPAIPTTSTPAPLPVQDAPSPVPSPAAAPVSISVSDPLPPKSAAPTPSPEAFAATPIPTTSFTPIPEDTQPPLVIDVEMDDPIVQLASNFSSKGDSLPPTRPASQPPQPSHSQTQAADITQPNHSRQLNRSHSAGPLALPCLPTSDPVGTPALSQSTIITRERPKSVAGPSLRRSLSIGPLALPMPEPLPEPVVESPAENTPTINSTGIDESCPPSDGLPLPSSPPAARSNKNFVKKFAIKQRLEEAIMNGEMPPFCSNCGAIETPTWRKIWTQECDGSPEDCEFSEKPGRVTAVEVLERDEEGNAKLHRVIKKSLASTDEKTKWEEALLCNPCGIWLVKWRTHRPADRWDKDASRLGQERKRKGAGRSTSRTKKSRSRSDGLLNPTSEAYLLTDAMDSVAPSSPKLNEGPPHDLEILRLDSNLNLEITEEDIGDKLDQIMQPGSTHSAGTGTAQSPIDIEFDEAVGSTKRLLFPSPRKDGTLKVLCNLDVNLVQTSDCAQPNGLKEDKENAVSAAQGGNDHKHDDLEALFRSPPKERPTTPLSASRSGPAEPFKTPTRPTPNHRPITRSVSKSIRSARSTILSPSRLVLEQTPTKTPRSGLKVPGSSTRRRSPRNHHTNFDIFDSPLSRSIVQLLSEGNALGPGDNELDINNLPQLERHRDQLIDFGNLLSTDDVMPSSPPKNSSATISFDYDGSTDFYDAWMAQNMSHGD